MIQPKLLFYTTLFLVLYVSAAAQTVSQKLAGAFQQFEQDAQLQSALISLYVADGSGNVVFQKAATIGLAPASTQKIITTATAYALLGQSFRYKTSFYFIKDNSLYIRGSGDPTLGSWRWNSTKESAVIDRIRRAAAGRAIHATIYIDTTGWSGETIPGGWVWEDIGNYYGAGAGVLNWRENQYDVALRSGTAVGDPVVITGTEPLLENHPLTSKATSAAKGSGDNAYIYFPLSGNAGVVRGTIPINEARFVISGAFPDPPRQLGAALLRNLRDGAAVDSLIPTGSAVQSLLLFHTEVSPPLDSLIYWFNKKSINLYGEALLKTIAYQKSGVASGEAGMDILKTFWKKQGIAETALNLVDGSGLSPLNRITTKAQVAILQYAKKQPWFTPFYNALPEYNGMKLKSGTIHGVKGFAGYHTSRAGVSYTISFLVNNYNGSSAALVKKMYAVLDVLK
jgi:D-alanyl-D-alanine carboxypeptidase/D-alanyl-D-alanine-endopeptidase (penicillin-binding protein 4)